MIFISVHIPKTAGTSLAYTIDIGSDRAVMYDYAADYSNRLFTADKQKLFEAAIPFVLDKFRFIHGHFYLEKYIHLLPQARTMTCFRHPVDRIISQYRHIALEQNENNKNFQAIRAGMSVVDFAQGDVNIRNAHLVHLGSIPPTDLDYIFLAQDLKNSVRLFASMYPDLIINKWVTSPNLNTSEQRANRLGPLPSYGQVTDNERAELQRVAADDISYYRLAYEAYAVQKKRILERL